MSSTYYTVLKIENKLSTDLTGGKAVIEKGTLLGSLPESITAGSTSAEIRINATNGDDGSRGRIEYKYTAGNKERTVSFLFKCDNTSSNNAKVLASDPSTLETNTSPYSADDHPLRVTYTIGQAN
ncbi:hypothetical protein AAE478_008364 [Parahypoxylon ruwenzoriense]